MTTLEYDLFDELGNRKYLTVEERQRYFESVEPALPKSLDREKRTFALLLYYTGCRISEGLGVANGHVDYSKKGVVFKTLKRRKTIYRFVPLSASFLTKLDDVHRVKDYQKERGGKMDPIWSFGRTTAWKLIKAVMDWANIEGAQATPKGLRHSFVIQHMALGTPGHMIQRWLGWASRDMMEVCGRATGAEEHDLASKLWGK